MKPRLLSSARTTFPLTSAIAALLASQSAMGQTNRYWDTNGTTTGFGAAGGTWTTPTVSQWSTSSIGTATPGASITTAINDPLHFGTDTAGGSLGGGTITVSGTVNAASLRFGSQTTGNVTLSGGTINLAAAASIHVGAGGVTLHTIASTITGAGTSLTKTGNTLRLSANNTFTGQTIISAGNLVLNNVTALGGNNPGVNGTSSISMAANTTLQSNYAPTDAGITDSYVYAPITLTAAGTNNFHIGNGSSTDPAESVRFNINGVISGNAGANVVFGNTTASRNNADSIIVLGAASTYNGNTTIQAGNVQNRINVIAGVANALPSTTVLGFDAVAGSGSGRTTQYNLNGNNQTLAGLENGGTVASLRNIRVHNSGALATLTINGSGNSIFGGANGSQNAQITGAINLTKNGTGTFTLAAGAGNGFTGATNILGGILVLGQNSSIQNSAFDTSSVAGDASNGLRIGIGGTGITSLIIGGLTGSNDFATRITTTDGGYGNLAELRLNPGTGATPSYSGDVGNGNGAMALTKTGAGTQTLAGTNTYTGATTVFGGVLSVTGSLANTSSTTISGTGTLKGSGSINSSVTIGSGGTLASGTSIESLAVGGDLSFTTGSAFQYELDKDAAPTVAGDLTAVTGSLSLAGTVTLSFVETGIGSWELGNPVGDHFGSPAADKLTLISYNGTWNGGLFTYLGNLVQDDSSIVINGQQWWFNYNDTDAGTNFTGDLGGATRFVTITVPEPQAALLGGLGLLALLRRRRY
jgi:autotransporter-associated beta strand protein